MKIVQSIAFLLFTAAAGIVRVGACDVTFKVYNADENSYFETIDSTDPEAPMVTVGSGYRPCFDLSIEAAVSANCGLVTAPVRLMLRQDTTIVHTKNEFNAPYFLYGNTGGDIVGKSLEGVYSVRARVNGVWTPYYYYYLPPCCDTCEDDEV